MDNAIPVPRVFAPSRAAGLGVAEMLTSFVVSVAYSLVKFIGELITFVSPTFVRRRFSI